MRGLFLPLVYLACAALPASAAEVDYLRDVKPILSARCYACHSAVRQKAGLRLDALSLIHKGGKSNPVIVPGKADQSLLLDAVLARDRPRMPPQGEGEALKDGDIATLRAWISQGAKGPNEPIPADPRNHWAFRPPSKAPAPAVRNPPAEIRNPIDAFVMTAWQKQGLHPNPPAERAVLLRRVFLDLVGIPPTRDELHAFLADKSPDAYEKVVDRLLASPQYGERWGRHWMDVWRYSDPFGFGQEYRYSQRHIWRWRDWIIESLNADKGYDRMIVEMLAGDEIAPADRDTLRATGYLARNWYKFNRNAWLQDSVEYTSAGFLGLTLRCARCHDHKYDPLPQQDYYRFRAFFEPHDIRIDPLPGQPDLMKDGVARAFDAHADAPTYLFRRGDERTPDKSRLLTPAVPAVLGGDLLVKPVQFAGPDLLRALEPAAVEARRLARADLQAADEGVKKSTEAVAAARRRLEQLAKGVKPVEEPAPPFLHDTFAKARPDVWQVIRGQWAWEKGRLVCQTPSPFATVTTKTNHPANLMGRVRYRTTGGGVRSVGLSYDVAGDSFQAIYINAGDNSAVRAFHRLKGQDAYPQEGVVPHPVKVGEEITLDFAVRGDLLNTWVNGKLRNVYRLPTPRQAGAFSLWTHDATAEFLELRLDAVGEGVLLAETPGQDRPSPVGGPLVLTRADAEQALRQAEADAEAMLRKQAIARAAIAAVEARVAADQARFAGSTDRLGPLARAATRAERKVAVLQAEAALNLAEQALTQAKAGPMPQTAPAKQALTAAEQKQAAAKQSLTAAQALAARDEDAYTPLVRLNPAASTGRRLALARWITDRNNPLTARVAVNHIWMRHFGKPLVASVANFGLAGKKPSHPELLDYLAVEFMESGWSMKKLHRLIVTSTTYRLDSHASDPANLAADPENIYLSHMNPRRMEAEAVRDSILATAGQLDRTLGGPILDETQGQTSRRRTIYFRFNTEYRIQFLDQFDAASTTECYERRESVIPQQALALANSALALNQSRLLARQLSQTAAEPGAFVIAAFEQVLSRPPTPAEKTRCERFLREQAELVKDPAKLQPFPPGPDAVTPAAADAGQRARENLIQVLYNHNDFVTIR
jgi:Protein of unknown function (DUF1553)/Protein of unknown function (DUF1549)/Planctomycete cytochrome C